MNLKFAITCGACETKVPVPADPTGGLDSWKQNEAAWEAHAAGCEKWQESQREAARKERIYEREREERANLEALEDALRVAHRSKDTVLWGRLEALVRRAKKRHYKAAQDERLARWG